MQTKPEHWELILLDPLPASKDLGCLGVGDFDGDGRPEVIVGGNGGLFWYRPTTFEQGLIARGHYHVGMAVGDLDNDGHLELVVGEERAQGSELWRLVWFKPTGNLTQPWEKYTIDPTSAGGPHDIIFADVDNDGEQEIVSNAAYSATPGVYIYKRQENPTQAWHKHQLQTGFVEEGLAAADLDGDGKVEIVSGPVYYTQTQGGPFAGPWHKHPLAINFREMCRLTLLDISGNGRPDVIITDSEYLDGRLSWFENRLQEDPAHPWVEHAIAENLYYSHSIYAWHNSDGVNIFVAEMLIGGWDAPRKATASLLKFTSPDKGQTWQRQVINAEAGTHQATLYDIDRDGRLEVLGKQSLGLPQVQMWKQPRTPSPLTQFQHRFLDRDKPYTAIDILAADIDGDGRADVVCGAWWYKNPTWERYEIPSIYQVINAYDLDGDGRLELIAIKANEQGKNAYERLCSDLWWLKVQDPIKGEWEAYHIGIGNGDWPHGSVIAPFLPNGKLALVVGYHHADEQQYPEIFEIPTDPRQPWKQRVIAEIAYGEELLAHDLDGDGKLDIIAGNYWLENRGDGTFRPHTISPDFKPARIAIGDINGDGKTEVIAAEEVLDFDKRVTPFSRLVWFEQPADLKQGDWQMHVIDQVRCGHSVGLADLDGDGELEVICGEHDPFWPYRSQCRLLVYKKAEARGRAWKRYVLDGRFEHHDGAKVIELEPGRIGIISHGWAESIYVHLWEPQITATSR